MSKEQIKIDPLFSNLLPPLTAEQFASLKKNIKSINRVLKPIIVWKERGILLDGHNRRKIAESLGIGYRVDFLSFADEQAAGRWVIDHQQGQRNWNDFQRGESELRLKELVAAAAEKRMKSGKADPGQNSAQGKTNDILGESAGVSRDTIAKIEKVTETGAKPLVDLARAGEVSLHAAATIATLPKSEQREIIAKGPDAIKEAAKEIRQEARLAPTEDQPWRGYNKLIDDACGHIESAHELVKQVKSLNGQQTPFHDWLSMKQYDRFFSDTIATLRGHLVAGWSTEEQRKKLPDARPFIFECEVGGKKRKSK